MRVLVTGKGSYIGEHIKAHLESFGFSVDEVDTISDDWEKICYSQYDSIIHVAAIVHNNAKKASEELFYKVNTELPVCIAKIAKNSGVKQFIFLSTMGVYGREKTLSTTESVIEDNTPLKAVGMYGKSKLEAEERLKELEDDNFRIAIVRPPNVYGPGCRGNYIQLFKKLALKLYFCPYAFTNIRQSMLYIDNLSELIHLIVLNGSNGVFLPQDDAIPSTVDIIRIIRESFGKRTHYSRILGLFVMACKSLPLIKKIYGGIQYDMKSSNCFDKKYQIISFSQGMKHTYQSWKE